MKDLPNYAFEDTYGMTNEQVNALAAKGEITLTKFRHGGKWFGGDIIGPVRDRGLNEEVVGTLHMRFDNEVDMYAELAEVTEKRDGKTKSSKTVRHRSR